MVSSGRNLFRITPEHQPVARLLGLDIDTIFTHPQVQVWRSIADRENAFLDFEGGDGRPRRWHVKRYTAVGRRRATPAEVEVRGIELLAGRGIPTVPLVGWGVAADGRSVVLIEDLAEHRPCNKLLFGGMRYEPVLEPTADLAARLHVAGLHHRDLYLCHFFTKPPGEARGDDAPLDLRLIDCARVQSLPRFFRRRWIVKDLAQYWYSSLKHEQITDADRLNWLRRYAQQSRVGDVDGLRRSILRKVASIARHDARLNRNRPNRNVSIPTISPDGTPNIRVSDSEAGGGR
jgi:hypothetical protein